MDREATGGGAGQPGSSAAKAADAPFVVAVIELTVPLDVPITAGPFEKQSAVGALMDKMLDVLPEEFAEHVGNGHWEHYVPEPGADA